MPAKEISRFKKKEIPKRPRLWYDGSIGTNSGGGRRRGERGDAAVGKRISGLALLLALALCGCSSGTVDELYAPPRLPQEYVQLDARISALREELGAEYASPKTGGNTAPVQLQDLDGDGQAESIVAFFRAGSGEQPLKIYVFRRNADNSYDVAHTIEGDGLAIQSVRYVDLDGDGGKEIVVSWRMGARQFILTPYRLAQAGAIQLAEISYNHGYTDCDLDQDNRRELAVFRVDDTAPDNGWADYYVYEDGQVVLSSSARLSDNAGGDASIREGSLINNIPAVYISSKSGDGTVTDVFTLREGKLKNITLNERTGVSSQTLRYVDISPADINRDGILELPEPVAVKEYSSTATAPNFWLIRWRQFDVDGFSQVVQTTYHNFNDGWYLAVPDGWIKEVTISRDDSRASQGERTVVFSRWNGDPDKAPQEFLRIYRLEGENRELRAQRGSRFVLLRSSRLIYAAEFSQIGWDPGVNRDTLGSCFALSRTEWSNQ